MPIPPVSVSFKLCPKFTDCLLLPCRLNVQVSIKTHLTESLVFQVCDTTETNTVSLNLHRKLQNRSGNMKSALRTVVPFLASLVVCQCIVV